MNESNNGLKIMVGLLGVAVIVLAVLLVKNRQTSTDQTHFYQDLSNQVQEATVEISDDRQTIANLEADLAARQSDILVLSNTLATTLTNQDQMQTALQTAETVITKLEEHNRALESRAGDLNAIIGELTSKIEAVSQQLAAAKGDRAALSAELERLTSEKLELERRFNDLDSLRAQVKKIKSEQAVARRLEWQRAGIQTTEPKGSEKMMGTGAAAPVKSSTYDLNVEVKEDGSLRVIPPLKQEQ